MTSYVDMVENNHITHPNERFDKASKTRIRWKWVKLGVGVLIVNTIGVGTIVYGWHTFQKADQGLGACHIKMACNYDGASDSYRCESECDVKGVAYGFMEGVAMMAIGAVYEAASNVFTYIFDQGRREYTALATSESILKIRDLLGKATPRAFANEYLPELPNLVELGIFPEDEVEAYMSQLEQHDRDVVSGEQMLITLNGDGHEDSWYGYKQRLLAKIPNPILP